MVGCSAVMLFVHLVVQQNHRGEVRLVVLLVRKLACKKLVVQMVSSAYDQCATNYLRAVKAPWRDAMNITCHVMNSNAVCKLLGYKSSCALPPQTVCAARFPLQIIPNSDYSSLYPLVDTRHHTTHHTATTRPPSDQPTMSQ